MAVKSFMPQKNSCSFFKVALAQIARGYRRWRRQRRALSSGFTVSKSL